jgi:heterodisulfide reductase subunit B
MKYVKYMYYPGCSLHSTASEYDLSFRKVCKRLGIDVEEVKDWTCCGTTPAHATSRLLSTALPLKVLADAERAGATELLVPCASCVQRLKIAVHEAEGDEGLKRRVDEALGVSYGFSVRILHPLEIFAGEEMLARIEREVRREPGQLRVVCYYGCLLTRPPKVMRFDECEYPMSMDRILRAAGVETLDWCYKTDCCGAALALTRTEIVRKLGFEILNEARAVGAEAVAVACPLCHANLDTRQEEIGREYGTDFRLPVFYFTQLMGLAFGISRHELGLEKHLVSPMELIEAKKL